MTNNAKSKNIKVRRFSSVCKGRRSKPSELLKGIRYGTVAMDIDIKTAAKMIGTPEVTLRRWARQGKIPARERAGAYVFRKSELAKWARRRNMTIMDSVKPAPADPAVGEIRLWEAMKRGGVLYAVPGDNVEAVLKAAVTSISLPETVDRQALLDRLLQREALASTGIGNGVAFPHPRYPLDDFSPGAMVVACFLEKEVDFKAVDGLPVFVLFIILSPDTKTHLKLLSRLSFCLRKDSFIRFLRKCEDPDVLLRKVQEIEEDMFRNEKKDGV